LPNGEGTLYNSDGSVNKKGTFEGGEFVGEWESYAL
jgi:hypothetical protein